MIRTCFDLEVVTFVRFVSIYQIKNYGNGWIYIALKKVIMIIYFSYHEKCDNFVSTHVLKHSFQQLKQHLNY